MNRTLKKALLGIAVGAAVVGVLTAVRFLLTPNNQRTVSADYYRSLAPDTSTEDPLLYLNEDFTVRPGFHSNLPLVVIRLDEPLAEYKHFLSGDHSPENVRLQDGTVGLDPDIWVQTDPQSGEYVNTAVDPWTTGTMTLYAEHGGNAALADSPDSVLPIRIKKRGHTSIAFDKSQYYIKTLDDAGQELPADIFGMGAGDSWVLNGSMADKSMLRNYLAYRTAAQIMDYAPRCTFCEVLLEDGGTATYQGVFLMTESVARGENRVNIDDAKKKNVFTSYLIRRDRYTVFDTMVSSHALEAGIDAEWLGVKYPSTPKQTEANLAFIREDFSTVEQTVYSDVKDIYNRYSRVIDVDSFVDYFLINEFFGNYDAGEHSTYMYKNSGEPLHIGPVWDFDQAMNNSMVDETDPYTIAMQDRALFKGLVRDTVFVDKLKSRYFDLSDGPLSEKALFAMIDEAIAHLTSARAREWYRWAADYYDNSGRNPGNYYLQDYTKEGVTLSRFSDSYEQEIYNIKVYISKHSKMIQPCLTDLTQSCTETTGILGQAPMALIILCLFLAPSIIINRK